MSPGLTDLGQISTFSETTIQHRNNMLYMGNVYARRKLGISLLLYSYLLEATKMKQSAIAISIHLMQMK